MIPQVYHFPDSCRDVSDGESQSGMDFPLGRQCIAPPRKYLNQVIATLKRLLESIELLELEQFRSKLEQVFSALLNFKIKVGFIGLTNSGKSTTLNALLGQNFLPIAAQRETVCPVCIIHDPKPSNFAKLSGRTEDNRLDDLHCESNAKSVRAKIRELNKEDRKVCKTQYTELVLHAPIFCLDKKEMSNYELYDTPGICEGNESVATIQAKTLFEELSTVILVISPDSADLKNLSDLIKRIKETYPDMIKDQNRILVLINKYDRCYSDDATIETSTWDPKTLKDKIAKQTTVPPEQIIYFSAWCALEARLWRSDPSVYNKTKHGMTYDFLCSKGKKEKIHSLKKYTSKNAKKLVKVYERFSQIHKVEEKLCEAIFNNRLAVLLKKSLEDTCHVIDNAKKSIYERKESLKNDMDELNSLIQRINEFLNDHCRNSVSSSLDNALKNYRENLKTSTSALMEGIRSEARRVVLSLHGQFETKDELKTRVITTRTGVVQFIEARIEELWNRCIQDTKVKLRSQLQQIVSKLKQDIVIARLTDNLNFQDVASPDRLVESLSFSSVQQPSFRSSISDTAMDALILPRTVIRQKNVNKERSVSGGRKYGFFGARRKIKIPYNEVVNYEAKVHELNMASFVRAFEQIASESADFVCNALELDITKQTTRLSQSFMSELKQISEHPLRTLKKTLDLKRKQHQDFDEKVKYLDERHQEFSSAVDQLLSQQGSGQGSSQSGTLEAPAFTTQLSTSE